MLWSATQKMPMPESVGCCVEKRPVQAMIIELASAALVQVTTAVPKSEPVMVKKDCSAADWLMRRPAPKSLVVFVKSTSPMSVTVRNVSALISTPSHVRLSAEPLPVT